MFGKLVDEKVATGYAAGNPPAQAPVVVASPPTGGGGGGGGSSGGSGGGRGGRGDPRRRKIDEILGILRVGPATGGELHRAIWRATHMDLTEAEPLLLAMFDKVVPHRKNAAVWWHVLTCALARCGTRASLPRLEKILVDGTYDLHVKDIARLAITRIDPDRGIELARARDCPRRDHRSTRSRQRARARDRRRAIDRRQPHRSAQRGQRAPAAHTPRRRVS